MAADNVKEWDVSGVAARFATARESAPLDVLAGQHDLTVKQAFEIRAYYGYEGSINQATGGREYDPVIFNEMLMLHRMDLKRWEDLEAGGRTFEYRKSALTLEVVDFVGKVSDWEWLGGDRGKRSASVSLSIPTTSGEKEKTFSPVLVGGALERELEAVKQGQAIRLQVALKTGRESELVSITQMERMPELKSVQTTAVGY